jgi:hypothetical protein
MIATSKEDKNLADYIAKLRTHLDERESFLRTELRKENLPNSSIINHCIADGICTCGYGQQRLVEGDDTQMFSEELLNNYRLPTRSNS